MVTETCSASVLLVEDNDSEAARMVELLAGRAPGEFHFERVGTFADAMALSNSQKYAAAILGLNLPDRAGAAVWRDFMANHAGTPVVLIADEPNPQIEEQAVREGVQDLLLRSEISGASLVRALNRAIVRESRVTLLHRQHRESMAAEARIRNLLIDSAEGIAIVNKSGVVLFANDQAMRWTGTTSTDRLVGSRFPLQLPSSGIGHVEVAVDIDRDVPGGLRRIRVLSVELRTMSSVWAGQPVSIVTMRDVTHQQHETTRLMLQTRLDRLIAESDGDVRHVCDVVADHLPRLVPYQTLEIAIARADGVPAEVILQRESHRHHDSAAMHGELPTWSVPLGGADFPRGWISVSLRPGLSFDPLTLDTLNQVAALVSARLGLRSVWWEEAG